MSDDIAITNITAGEGPVIARCDVLLNGLVRIYGVTVRRGRGHATYVNLPRQWRAGHWQPAVEIVDSALLEVVRSEVLLHVAQQANTCSLVR